ncbi:acyl-[acyl-carrier-protein]--UDP-N-acetylglucosamine O-acyltransferase [Ranunculus cassubicifolius]
MESLSNSLIGQDVSIGPFSTTGPNAKLGNGYQLYAGSHISGYTELGDRCTVMTDAIVGEDLPGSTTIGCNNLIGHHAVVGARCEDLKYKLGDECFLHVGDHNDIREFTSIHRSSKSSYWRQVHDCKVGNNYIFANGAFFAGYIVVEFHNSKLINLICDNMVKLIVNTRRSSVRDIVTYKDL